MTSVQHGLSEFSSPASEDRGDLRFVSIPNLVLINRDRFSDKEALVGGGRRITYRRLADEMLHAGAAMLAYGVRPGDRLAIWAPNSVQWVLAALSAQAVGGVLVPINTRLHPEEVAYQLDRTEAKLLLTVGDFLDRDYAAWMRPHLARLPSVRQVVTIDDVPSAGSVTWTEFVSGAPGSTAAVDASVAAVSGEQLSDIIFTSGTTGLPKGVMLTHSQSLRGFWGLNQGFGVGQEDRLAVIAPFSHSFGYKAGWLLSFMAGACAYPQPVLDVGSLLDLIASERITVLPGPPTMFQGLFNALALGQHDVTSLRLCYVGATTILPELVKRLYSEFGVERVCTGYGLTEATAVVSTTGPDDDADRVAVWCGRPVEGVSIRIVDEAGRVVPLGDSGEIQVRGFNVMQGYLNDSEATASAISLDGWLRTGDAGVMDEHGYLRIVDRLKDIYIVGGFNVSPAEVERVVTGHESVEEAAVVGVTDERLGEVGAAFIVLRRGHQLSEESLLEWCRDRMANFKVPRYVTFCQELPRNSTGKVLKSQLRRAQPTSGADDVGTSV